MPPDKRDDTHARDSEAAPRGLTGSVGWSLLGILVAAGLVHTYAGLELLGLRWDGGPFLQDMLSARAFFSYEPQRATTQIIFELPTLIAVRLGITDLYWLSAIWSLSLQLAPLLLIGASYFVLPARHKMFFALPVFSYFAGASSVASSGMLEGPTATAYFWILFFLVLFTPERWVARIAVMIMAVSTFVLHEIMAVLAPLLIYAAWWRGKQTEDRAARLFFRILAIVFLVVMMVHIYHVILPEDVKNRDKFVDHFVALQWLFRAGINVPAALGLLGGAAILAMWLFSRYSTAIVVSFAVATVLVLKLALTYGIAEQFSARNHPAIISIPLAMIAMGALQWPTIASELISAHAVKSAMILVLLACAGLTTEVITIRNWSEYIAIYRQVVADRTGFIAWEDLMKELSPGEARVLRRMNFDWTNPSMSILLSPQGHVRSLVMNPPTAWQQWDPTIPSKWPNAWFYDRSAFPADGGDPSRRVESN